MRFYVQAQSFNIIIQEVQLQRAKNAVTFHDPSYMHLILMVMKEIMLACS